MHDITKSPALGQSANADNGFAETVTFLTALFGDPEKAYVAAFTDQSAANWTGGHGIARFADLIQRGADAYFTIGRIADGETRRSAAGVDLRVAVGVDDVGGKTDPQMWADLFARGCPEPMAAVETSPGNSQFFWRLDPPIPSTDSAGVADLQHFRGLLADAGLTDAATIDVAHFFRLGAGHNSKQKHKDANRGVAPSVRYTRLDPLRAVSLEALATGVFGPNWRGLPITGKSAQVATTTPVGGARPRNAAMTDALVVMAAEIGLNPTAKGNGVIEAICPNVAAHTPDGREETGFAFVGDGTCACQHSHCAGLKSPDFARMIRERFNAEMAARRAMGLPCRAADADALTLQIAAEVFAAAPIDARQLALLTGSTGAGAGGAAARTVAGLSRKPIQPVQRFAAAQLPPRQWLYGTSYARGVYSLLVAAGGSGKSALAMVEAVAMATGKELLSGEKVANRPLTVWLHNGEDSDDEQQRRLAAALIYHGVNYADLGDRLILTSGHDHPIKLGGMGREGPELTPGAGEWITQTARALKVDVLILDPLGAVHGLPENSNEAMNLLAGGLRRIAVAANIAIGLVHHVGQAAAGNMAAAGANAARGATALTDAARIVRQIIRPDPKEAPGLGIKSEDRWRYLQVVNGKANMSSIADANWLKLVSVRLGNATPDYPSGDEVQTVERWVPPKGLACAPNDLARLQDAIRARGVLPRLAPQAPDWIGYLLADVTGMDAGRGLTNATRTAAQLDARARVTAMVQSWIASGGLVIERRADPKGKTDDMIEVVAPGLPAMIAQTAPQGAGPDDPEGANLEGV